MNRNNHIDYLKLWGLTGLFTLYSIAVVAQSSTSGQLTIKNANTPLAYLEYQNKPLLAFGAHLEHMLFDDYDYKAWTEWMLDHGMNQARTRLYHAYYRNYSPFYKTADGRYDLTKWDDSFWERSKEILTYLERKGIIVHLLIFPQGTGGTWWQGDGYYLPENNVHPETAYIRPEKSTAGFWKSWSEGKHELYEIQTAILWKMIEETAQFNNIIYDICHEPFLHAMNEEDLEDFKEFMDETTKRFVKKYQEIKPGKVPIMGFDTDFTPPGEIRDWIYGHDYLNVMVQGKNHDPFYITAEEAVDLVKKFKKPFVPQESLDPPGVEHIPGIKHKNSLTFYESESRHHIRKYVWRWIMARSQVIDIYQKSLRKDVENKERYDPEGHNLFSEDAMVIRKFWDNLVDYPNLDFKGQVSSSDCSIKMALSSDKEAVIYLSSNPGEQNVQFAAQEISLSDLKLSDGNYKVEIWQLAAPGGIVSSLELEFTKGKADLSLPTFTDDMAIHITAQ